MHIYQCGLIQIYHHFLCLSLLLILFSKCSSRFRKCMQNYFLLSMKHVNFVDLCCCVRLQMFKCFPFAHINSLVRSLIHTEQKKKSHRWKLTYALCVHVKNWIWIISSSFSFIKLFQANLGSHFVAIELVGERICAKLRCRIVVNFHWIMVLLTVCLFA